MINHENVSFVYLMITKTMKVNVVVSDDNALCVASGDKTNLLHDGKREK